MQREQRKLAAIVAGDVIEYSRLMGLDEEGTLRAIRSHRAELVDPARAWQLGVRSMELFVRFNTSDQSGLSD